MVGSLFIVQVPVLNKCSRTFLRSFGVRVTKVATRTCSCSSWSPRPPRPPRPCSPRSTCRWGSRTCKGNGTVVWSTSALLHFKERAESIILFRAHNLEFALYIAIQFVFLEMSQSFNLLKQGLVYFWRLKIKENGLIT